VCVRQPRLGRLGRPGRLGRLGRNRGCTADASARAETEAGGGGGRRALIDGSLSVSGLKRHAVPVAEVLLLVQTNQLHPLIGIGVSVGIV